MNKFAQILKSSLFHILLLAALLVTVRVSTHPAGLNQYGYDYGFYAYTSTHLPNLKAEYMIGRDDDYGNHLFVISNWLQLPPIATMELIFILFFVGSLTILYLSLRKYSASAAIFGSLLFILSVAQTQSYSMFLWKNSYGQFLLLLLFYFVQTKQLLWQLLPVLLLIITHKTSSLVALLSLGSNYLFTQTKKREHILFVILATTIVFLVFLNGIDYIKNLSASNVRDGIFLTVSKYLKYSWFLIPISGLGIYHSIKSKANITWITMLGLSLTMIVLGTVFYQRMIFYTDLALIFFAALSLHFLQLTKKLKYVVAVCVIAISALSLYNFSLSIEPSISETEITEIQEFSKNNQGSFVLAGSAQDGPWLLGNLSGNIRLAAPGMFEDHHSLVFWQEFWLNPHNKEFLNSYPQPLYLYQRSNNFPIEPWACLEKIGENFYKYTCYEKSLQ